MVEAKIGPDVETIVWDLDGTLLNSFGLYKDCLNDALRICGRPTVPDWALRGHRHGTLAESTRGVLQAAGQKVSEADLKRILRLFLELDHSAMKDPTRLLFDDAVRVAEDAYNAGKRQIIVTNRFHGPSPDGLTRRHGSPRSIIGRSILKNFIPEEDIICGDDFGDDSDAPRKPSPEVLKARYGSNFSAALGKLAVIGDQAIDVWFARNIAHQSNGVVAAILVDRTNSKDHPDRWQMLTPDQKNPVHIVPSLMDVKIEV